MFNKSIMVVKIKANSLYLGVCLFFSICYSFLYSNYLTKDPILNRDDVLFIYPLKAVVGLSGYINAVKTNSIPDFQPVRDLTFLINLKIMEWFHFSTFHMTNFIFFIVTIFLFMKLLEALGFGKKQIVYSAFFYATHPLMVSSVGWISARKHSLALVFILLSLLDFIKKRKITTASIFCYVLSILSHQIFILLPIWIYIYEKVKKINLEIGRFAIMSLMGLLVLFLGVMKTFYLEMGNVTYKQFHWFNNVSRYVLSVGRSVVQIFFPVSISSDYFQGNILNLIGIPVLIFSLFLLYKSKNRADSFLWIFLAALSHILTYITFVNDTYLYLPLICSLIAINFYFTNNPVRLNPKIKMTAFTLLLSLLAAKTISSSQMWRSDLDVWKYSYSNEPSPFTSIVFGINLLKYDKKIALELIVWGAKNYDLVNSKAHFIAFLEIIYTSSLPIQQKIAIYKDCYKDHEIYKAFYGLALLEGTSEQMEEGIKMLKPILLDESKYTPSSHGIGIIKAIKFLCKNFQGKSLACTKLGINY